MTENVFITGANGGFGRLTTLSLLDAGHTVVASMRNTDTRSLDAAAATADVIAARPPETAHHDAPLRYQGTP